MSVVFSEVKLDLQPGGGTPILHLTGSATEQGVLL